MRRTGSITITFDRINLLIIGFSLISFVVLIKLVYIQLIKHKQYMSMGHDQYWNLQEIPAKRGSILSNEGNLLATTQIHYLLFAEPQRITDKPATAKQLAEVLTKMENPDISPTESTATNQYTTRYTSIMEPLSSKLLWIIIEHDLTPIEKEEIEKLQIQGIGFEEEPIRFYPEGTLAAHVLGFVAFNEQGEKQGYYGIEGSYDEGLKGKPGKVVEEQDALGKPILMGNYRKIPPVDGWDIELTIQRPVQYIIEKYLKAGVETYNASSGTAIVMDPATGSILAMANYPTYKPDYFLEEETSEGNTTRKSIEKKNLAISETYEPGSVIKPLVISAAINLNKVNPQTTFEDKGPVRYSDYYIDNWDKKHHGTQNIIQLLQKSNNIGAAWVGHQLGAENLSKYFYKFGFGKKTGVELQGEDTGIIRKTSWTDIDIATASFGQGISATPLQVLNAFNVFANDGVLMKPRMVDKIIDHEKTITIPPTKIEKVLSHTTAETMVGLLTQAVEGGESKYYNIKNYKIAGKTGTAQIPHEGGYNPNETNVTFVGFPAVSKKFTLIVKLNRPKESIYAAETAVPLWMEITDELLKFYGVPPDL